ncbi:MAG: T9SS type A sorting domain-containing protein [Chitinophagaceae bacterium]|nr:T9SS type A sorting domain-containing protein [Chitinophagaceae bacterium]
MKRFTTLMLLATMLSAQTMVFAQVPVQVVSGYITTNTTWTKDNIYLLTGFVYVNNGATLTIEPGTLIKGDKFSKGALIISRGAKLMADGTAAEPIVFTSNGPTGFRTYGDWGGIILLGKATINQAGGEAIIEGGVDDGQGNGTYGGGTAPDDNDNSGILRYVRIEFPGIAFAPNNEINGLTCGGVGRGTVLEHIQVSYSGDDSYEFFGGTVNAKYLIAFRGLDDDFDTDNGFSGKLQFLYSLRDPNIADISGSNGFESDNDATGSTNAPNTHALFSNVTIAGPKVTSSNAFNASYKRGAHLRRNTQACIYNSILMGYPTGIMVDGASSEANATADILQVRNTILSGCASSFEVASGSTFDISGWFNTPAYSNTIYTANTDVMLTDVFNLAGPNPTPAVGSPALSGASFAATNLTDPFFEAVDFRGAFGTTDWTLGWANWTPNNSVYTAINDPKIISGINVYPNPMSTSATLELNLAEANNVNIAITDLSGRMITEVLNEQLSAGNHTIYFQTPQLANGMYFVQVRTLNENRMIKLNVAD